MEAAGLFVAAGGRTTFLARLANAAYEDGPSALPDGLAPLAVAGLEDGRYVDANGTAVALVGRADDALFIAFRGTDDATDESEWGVPQRHFARFAPLLAELDAYVADPANGIARAYATGHSLGGAMTEALLASRGDDLWSGVAFGSPGYGLGLPDVEDPRIVNVGISGDPAALLAALMGGRGDHYVVMDPDGTAGALDLLESHDVLAYVAVARFLDTGIAFPDPALAGNGRLDQAIQVPARFERLSATLDDEWDLRVTARDDVGLDRLFAASGYGTAATPTGLAFVGAPGAADAFTGGTSADTIFGMDGDDTLAGAAGTDGLSGGHGADTIHGGAGDDLVHGGRDGDALHGDRGADTLSGDRGDDSLWGGEGADVFLFAADGGHDLVLDFDPAEGDRIAVAAGLPFTLLAGAAGEAVLELEDGNGVTIAGVAPDAIGQIWVV
ncbi:MAG: hypothetical protein AB7P02_19375 [Alphaproteobacteria bacterium]